MADYYHSAVSEWKADIAKGKIPLFGPISFTNQIWRNTELESQIGFNFGFLASTNFRIVDPEMRQE
jgi:hypothetical protein